MHQACEEETCQNIDDFSLMNSSSVVRRVPSKNELDALFQRFTFDYYYHEACLLPKIYNVVKFPINTRLYCLFCNSVSKSPRNVNVTCTGLHGLRAPKDDIQAVSLQTYRQLPTDRTIPLGLEVFYLPEGETEYPDSLVYEVDLDKITHKSRFKIIFSYPNGIGNGIGSGTTIDDD